MGTQNKAAYNARKGLLGIAIAMAFAGQTTKEMRIGQMMMAGLRNHYRTIRPGSRSNAAAIKRASRKRRNIRARSAK